MAIRKIPLLCSFNCNGEAGLHTWNWSGHISWVKLGSVWTIRTFFFIASILTENLSVSQFSIFQFKIQNRQKIFENVIHNSLSFEGVHSWNEVQRDDVAIILIFENPDSCIWSLFLKSQPKWLFYKKYFTKLWLEVAFVKSSNVDHV